LDSRRVDGGPESEQSPTSNRPHDAAALSKSQQQGEGSMKKRAAITGIKLFIPVFFFSGTLYGGMGEPIPVAGQERNEGIASASFDGTNILLAIQGTNEAFKSISCRLMDAAGGLIGTRLNMSSCGNVPQVGYGGGTYLVTWVSSEGEDAQIYGQLVTPAGTTNGPPFRISFATSDVEPSWGKLPFGSGKFLVAWKDFRDPANDDSDIFARFVNPDGSFFGQDFAIASDNAGPEDGDDDDANVSVASDGTNFLAVFSAERRTGCYDGEDIYGQFISGTTGVTDGNNFIIDQNDLSSSNPTAVCWDGEKYAVLFHDAQIDDDEQWDIYARFVTPAGTVSVSRIAIAATPESEMFPSIAFNGEHYLITITREQTYGTVTNWVLQGRLWDKNLVPATPWFTLADPTNSNFPSSMVLAVGNHFVVGITQLDLENFNFIKTDVIIVDATPPRIESISIEGDSCLLAFENMFIGTSNRVEWAESLTDTNGWQLKDTIISTSTATNWSGDLESRDQGFARLRME